MSERQLLPGIPIGALAIIAPSLAAVVCTYRRDGKHAVAILLRRLFDWNRIGPVWMALIVCLMPACLLIAFFAMRFLRMPVPEPRVDFLSVPALVLIFLFAGALEELGWSGYAIDLLQEHRDALIAALILGVVWAVWHLIPLKEARRTNDWIAWWCLGSIALRVLHVWIYNNTGKSVFGAALFHASFNVSWQVFPNRGSHFDPMITSAVLIATASLVVLLFGPRRLART